MSKPSIIAIDGPAASGKTTLGRKLADALGYLYFDTGLMYRAVTFAALEQGVDIADETLVTDLAHTIHIEVGRADGTDGQRSILSIDGVDVTHRLRTAEVDANVSAVSAYLGVRDAMTRQQRRIGEQGRIVMVGRDIGTVVLPQADLKLYLDASVEERARRRWQDFRDGGSERTYESILDAMKERDRKDSSRAIAPMLPAEDAIRIDTTNMEMSALVEQVLSLLENGEEAPAQE